MLHLSNKKLQSLLLATLMLMGVSSCKKDDPEPDPDPEIPGVVSDIDGNEYTFVTIGEQVWMVENLKVTRYNDGESIALLPDNEAWANNEGGAYCWYQNDNEQYLEPYGALYSRDAAKSGKLCPSGWHVPNDDDWGQLIDFLGGWQSLPAHKLKEEGTEHWKEENQFFTTNETGFTARAGGMRNLDGTFEGVLEHGNWWSSEDHFQYKSWGRRMVYNQGYLLSIGTDDDMGFSVRCLKSE